MRGTDTFEFDIFACVLDRMEADDKQRILLNLTQLSDDLITSDVTPALIQDGIFTFDDKARIENQVNKTKINKLSHTA